MTGMSRTIVRDWHRNSVHVSSVHPTLGSIPRGRITADVRREGAGAFGVWQVINVDHEWLELLIVGDYLTAEGVLLDRTAWADQTEEG